MERKIPATFTDEQVINAEVATEILNRARAKLTTRIHEIEATQPEEADRLRRVRKEIYQTQSGITVWDDESVQAVTEYWGNLTRNEPAFWAAMNG